MSKKRCKRCLPTLRNSGNGKLNGWSESGSVMPRKSWETKVLKFGSLDSCIRAICDTWSSSLRGPNMNWNRRRTQMNSCFGSRNTQIGPLNWRREMRHWRKSTNPRKTGAGRNMFASLVGLDCHHQSSRSSRKKFSNNLASIMSCGTTVKPYYRTSRTKYWTTPPSIILGSGNIREPNSNKTKSRPIHQLKWQYSRTRFCGKVTINTTYIKFSTTLKSNNSSSNSKFNGIREWTQIRCSGLWIRRRTQASAQQPAQL